ncbi:MAG: ATP synthase F1 subunit gamma [Phycisphaera sp.]|nr:ATP synthase F1 subunit gamma [Phycisphaera sp.]
MAQLREIKKRIKAVGNIQRITKTMQMIATAKFQAAIRRAQDTKPYTQKLSEIVGELSGSAEHPLFRSPETPTGKELLLVLSSNRGLCGAYNSNVLRTAAAQIRGRRDVKTEIEVVGKKGVSFFKFQGFEIANSYSHFTDKPAYEDVEALATGYIDRFLAGEFDAVRVVYMKFISNARQKPEVLQMLPLQPVETGTDSDAKSSGPVPIYEFSPEPEQLLDALLPLSVKSNLFQCFNDAVVSEQIGRMVAMKAATDNAGKMGRGLKRSFNRARQAQITTELSEIIGGAAALG